MTPKFDLGLYQAKYTLRALLIKIPGISQLSPNLLSCSTFIPGIATAYCLYQGWWIGAVIAIALRMLLSTLDGLVAEEFNKTSPLGAYINRLPGEITDLLIILGLFPYIQFGWAIALIILTSWVQTFGLLGLVAGGKTQSVGPCGQTDRLAIIAISCIVAAFGVSVWQYVIPGMCIGCGLTVLLRIFRSIRDIKTQTVQ
jgi:phosphatidylglycerophosphate synthase